ncbi:MAG TPA: hypothetical protein DCY66_00820 [Bacteroides sp.]|nr:hypothetical protein [Bacteroides sp.]
MNIFDIAKQNQEKAWQVIKNTNIIQIWEDAGAKINLVGSLRTISRKTKCSTFAKHFVPKSHLLTQFKM